MFRKTKKIILIVVIIAIITFAITIKISDTIPIGRINEIEIKELGTQDKRAITIVNQAQIDAFTKFLNTRKTEYRFSGPSTCSWLRVTLNINGNKVVYSYEGDWDKLTEYDGPCSSAIKITRFFNLDPGFKEFMSPILAEGNLRTRYEYIKELKMKNVK